MSKLSFNIFMWKSKRNRCCIEVNRITAGYHVEIKQRCFMIYSNESLGECSEKCLIWRSFRFELESFEDLVSFTKRLISDITFAAYPFLRFLEIVKQNKEKLNIKRMYQFSKDVYLSCTFFRIELYLSKCVYTLMASRDK